MRLSSFNPAGLFRLIDAVAAGLADDPLATRVFGRIAAGRRVDAALALSTDRHHHAQAVALCRRLGVGMIDLAPRDHFSWDGVAVAVRIEPSVLIHEVAHYQMAAPDRRGLADFGLGAGPETGRKAEAERVRRLFSPECDVEEGLCSLLGILWEAELGQPALAAFVEQNWLEGGAGARNLAHLRKVTRWLAAMGLIDADGHPTTVLRREDDATFFTRWFAES